MSDDLQQIKKWFLILSVIITCITYPEGSHAQELRLYTTEEPPYNYIENDQPTGISVEIVQELDEARRQTNRHQLPPLGPRFALCKKQQKHSYLFYDTHFSKG